MSYTNVSKRKSQSVFSASWLKLIIKKNGWCGIMFIHEPVKNLTPKGWFPDTDEGLLIQAWIPSIPPGALWSLWWTKGTLPWLEQYTNNLHNITYNLHK